MSSFISISLQPWLFPFKCFIELQAITSLKTNLWVLIKDALLLPTVIRNAARVVNFSPMRQLLLNDSQPHTSHMYKALMELYFSQLERPSRGIS